MGVFELYLRFFGLLGDEEGQDLIEYALLIFFIALVVLVTVQAVGQTLLDVYYERIPAAFGS